MPLCGAEGLKLSVVVEKVIVSGLGGLGCCSIRMQISIRLASRVHMACACALKVGAADCSDYLHQPAWGRD